MVLKWSTLSAFLLIAACASAEPEEPTHVLQYGCDDLVIMGRVDTLTEQLSSNSESPLSSSVWGTEVTIKRVIRGSERRAVVPATGASHAQIRDNVDLLVVLSKSGNGPGYIIKTLNVWEGVSQLARSCSPRLLAIG